MSIVLSIYSEKAFREVALPEKAQEDIEILVQKELFALDRDVRLGLQYSGKGWFLSADRCTIDQKTQAGPVACGKITEVKKGIHYSVRTFGGSGLTVIASEKKDPFSVYRKYPLYGVSQIRIGRPVKPGEAFEISYADDSFVSHHHCLIAFQGGKAILTDSSRNGTYVNFRRVYGSTVLNYGDSIRIMRLHLIYLGSVLAVNQTEGITVSLRAAGMKDLERFASPGETALEEKVLFHRSPRNLKKLVTEPFEIEAPPQAQEHEPQPLAMLVGPSLTMALPMVMTSALSVWASRQTGSASGALMYISMVTAVSSALIGAAWAVVNVRNADKARKKNENRRFESYSDYLLRMRDKIQKAYTENSEAMRDRYLPAEQCTVLDQYSPLLWNRNATHEDFLSVRLGCGDLPFQAPIVIPKERFTMMVDSLADKPALIQENFKTLKDVPVTVDLLQNRLVGVAGGDNREGANEIAKVMIAQIAAANCYTDVKIGVIYDGSCDIDREIWNFAYWLPHVWSGDKKIRYIATSKAEMGDVFHEIAQVLRNRSEEEEKKEPKSFKPRFVLFVTDPKLLDGELITHYVFERNRDLGLTTVLLSARAEDLPNECECIVRCDRTFEGIYNTRDGMSNGTKILFDHVSKEGLEMMARTQGKIQVVESDLDGEIPATLTFFDMYGIGRPSELNAPARWKKSNSIASMRALVGFKNGNAPCYLDIHEKYHGPHGLVAGTTGSGKSETLQTYILSLCVNFSPEDIGFFIIDYKGGGMANLFDNLPHMIGSISNLSGNQVKRAMVSIQSENRRRQKIFTDYGVNNINGYTALYKNGDASEPVPHLFIIIDEFAELKREEPEFMKELISVAQVGRSLGVHLILSTQRPSGTVDENIWANSKFRLCLRVQDRQDSMDMLHRTDAAYLTQAGRCYLQVGNDEIFELFQSGWSGATYDEELGGSSLLIAQLLSATGKVDLAGNHAKIKRKEALKRKWAEELLGFMHGAEKDTGRSVLEPSFSFEESSDFKDAFYRRIQAAQPEFERNQFNNTRISDFIVTYKECASEKDPAALADKIVRAAAKEGRRLPETKSRTQLEVVIDYLKETAEKLGVAKQRKLWLPVLPTFLYLEDMEEFRRSSFDGKNWPEVPKRFRLSAVIGLADDPENQAQMAVSLNFTDGGHHFLAGTVSTGKSTFLQSAIFSLASGYTPEQLNIYCLDFSAKMLNVFSDLKTVGGYMDEGDLETDKISKFFTMMTRILDERKKKFAGTSYEDYINHNGWTVPAVLIVIDNYGSFHEKTGEDYEAIMMRIAKEGNGYGIYLLVTAGGIGMQEMPSRLAETFRTSLTLEMQDQFAYGDVLHIVKPPVTPEARVKGRGLIYYGERILEFQTALGARAEGSPERNDLLKEMVAKMNDAWHGVRARSIPSIPAKPVRSDFESLPEYQELLSDRTKLPVGWDFESADLASFDLVKNFAYLVSGAKQSGKSVFMENLMMTAAARGDEVIILEAGGERFQSIAEQHGWKRYTDGEGLLEFLTYLHGILVERSPLKKSCLDRKCSDEELFAEADANPRIDIFIGNMTGVITTIHDPDSPAKEGEALFETLCERGKGYNVFVFGEVGDKEAVEMAGYIAFGSLMNYRSGIRFGGRFGDQKLFAFENVSFQDQDRSMKPGIGVIPTDNRDDRLEKIVVPMS